MNVILLILIFIFVSMFMAGSAFLEFDILNPTINIIIIVIGIVGLIGVLVAYRMRLENSKKLKKDKKFKDL